MLKNKLFIFGSYILLFFVILFLLLIFAPSPLDKDTIIEVKSGSSAIELANDFSKQNIIRNKYFFIGLMEFFGLQKKLVVGEFEIKAKSNLFVVINDIINSRKIFSRKVTIPEGFTSKQIINALKANEYLGGNLPYSIKEGSMLPNTYFFNKNETRMSVVFRMQNNMNDYLDKLWANRDKSLPYKTKQEALTLASIVEKETGKASERYIIAGVFLNRLRLGMKIQSDPTVAYGLGLDSAKSLTKTQLKTPSPYNTYYVRALPKGPICNPGEDALYAVFHPAKTKHLYFVADGKGGHLFSDNLKTHNQLVSNWRKIEKNIK